MVENATKLAKLMVKGRKLIEDKFEEYKGLVGKKDFDDFEFLDSYVSEVGSWEKKVKTVLRTFNKQNYLIQFDSPKDIKHATSNYLFEADEKKVVAQLEVLTEILAEEEGGNAPKQSKKIVYWLEYTDNRQILINGRPLRRPKVNSLNNSLIAYLIKFPNQIVELETVEKVMECEGLSNGISGRVRDLGFGGDLGQMFFPVVNKQKIKLVNPITRQYLIDRHLPDLDLDSIM